jgi:hypothetical protein
LMPGAVKCAMSGERLARGDGRVVIARGADGGCWPIRNQCTIAYTPTNQATRRRLSHDSSRRVRTRTHQRPHQNLKLSEELAELLRRSIDIQHRMVRIRREEQREAVCANFEIAS